MANNRFKFNFSFGINVYRFKALEANIKKKNVPKKIRTQFILCLLFIK